MAKHRADKHASRGAIGVSPAIDNLRTLPEEEKLGLKRGIRFNFSRRVTADAYPFTGGRVEADFEAGQFMGTIDSQFKFIGEPLGHKKDHGRCQFFLHEEQVKSITFSPEAD